MRANRGRLIFALDATGSREATWDMAAKLQADMFKETARIGALDVQLLYYRGNDEVWQSPWLSDTHELIHLMGTIRCEYGATQITRVLQHIRAEHARGRVSAVVFIGDAVEEVPQKLYDAATNLGVPMFMFQEGNGVVVYHDWHHEPAGGQPVEDVFREIARLTNGAYGKFDAGAARQLGELLRAVAAFAAGGITALANQNTDSARKLLGQLK
jgi:hypothetical protein